MNSEVLVEYVGLKDRETDCVGGTGLVWIGLGSRQWVPAKAWEVMKKHTDVWKAVEPEEPAVADPAPAASQVVAVGLADSLKVVVATAPAPDVPPPAPAPKLTSVNKASVDEMRDALTKAGHELHPRLNQTKLRKMYGELIAEQKRAA